MRVSLKVRLCVGLSIVLGLAPSVAHAAMRIAPAGVTGAPGGYTVVGYSPSSSLQIALDPDGTLKRGPGHGRPVRKIGGLTSVSGAQRSSRGLVITGNLDTCPSSCQSQGELRISRVMPNGSLDRSFGTSGFVDVEASGFTGGTISAPRIDSKGRIVVATTSSGCLSTQGCLTSRKVFRYLPNGRPDRSFGARGVQDLGGGTDSARIEQASSVALNAKVIAVSTSFRTSTEEGGEIFELDSHGQPLDGFGDGGRVSVDRQPTNLVAQSDGGVIFSGAGNGEMYAAQLSPSGASDPEFGSGGISVVPLPTSAQADWIDRMVPSSRGGVVLAARVLGACEVEASKCLATVVVAGLNADGTTDSSFGQAGRVSLSQSRPEDAANRPPPFAMSRIRGRIVLITDAAGERRLVKLSENGRVVR